MKYINDSNWTEYYTETDPDKRKEIYDRVSEISDDGANDLRLRLYHHRYVDEKHPGRKADKGVMEMMIMPLNDKPKFRLIKNSTIKEIRKSLKNLGLEEAGDEDLSISAVYWEIRNSARRYFEHCKGPGYGRKWFGIMASTESEQLDLTARSVYLMADKIPSRFEMVSEMRIFSDAVRDEFTEMSPEANAAYERVVRQES